MMFSRAARRAGGTEPSRLIASAPTVNTNAIELGRKATRKFIMSPLTRLNSHWSVRPNSNPSTPPTTPMPVASASTLRNVNRRRLEAGQLAATVVHEVRRRDRPPDVGQQAVGIRTWGRGDLERRRDR